MSYFNVKISFSWGHVRVETFSTIKNTDRAIFTLKVCKKGVNGGRVALNTKKHGVGKAPTPYKLLTTISRYKDRCRQGVQP